MSDTWHDHKPGPRRSRGAGKGEDHKRRRQTTRRQLKTMIEEDYDDRD